MIVNRALILHTLFCFSRRLCYSYISYSFELEKGMDGRKPSWVEILKDSVEHQNLSHCLVQACSSQNQNHKRGLTCTNCIHILQAPITSCVVRSLLSQTTKCGCRKNCANGFLHFSEPQMRALAYSLLYTSAAILGPPKYSTFSAGTPTATSHKKQTMSIIDLDVRSTGYYSWAQREP
jgi:hypothetical protein